MDPGTVSVKSTSTDGLGAIGRDGVGGSAGLRRRGLVRATGRERESRQHGKRNVLSERGGEKENGKQREGVNHSRDRSLRASADVD